MSHGERIYPVQPDEYLAAAREFDSQIVGRGGDVEAAVTDHLQGCHRDFLRALHELGSMMTPIDRTTGIDPNLERAIQRGVTYGGIVGLAVTRKAHAPRVVDTAKVFRGFNSASLDVDGADDEMSERNDVAEALRDFGWAGMRDVGAETEELFENWEARAVSDVAHQSTFRIGAGFILHSVHVGFVRELETRRLRGLREIEQRLDSPDGIDWDGDLGRLLDDQ